MRAYILVHPKYGAFLGIVQELSLNLGRPYMGWTTVMNEKFPYYELPPFIICWKDRAEAEQWFNRVFSIHMPEDLELVEVNAPDEDKCPIHIAVKAGIPMWNCETVNRKNRPI